MLPIHGVCGICLHAWTPALMTVLLEPKPAGSVRAVIGKGMILLCSAAELLLRFGSAMCQALHSGSFNDVDEEARDGEFICQVCGRGCVLPSICIHWTLLRHAPPSKVYIRLNYAVGCAGVVPAAVKHCWRSPVITDPPALKHMRLLLSQKRRASSLVQGQAIRREQARAAPVGGEGADSSCFSSLCDEGLPPVIGR